MLRKIGIATLLLSGLLACGGGEESPPNILPEGTQTQTFIYNGNSLLRGVNGNYNTSPKGRSPAILEVTYQISCIAGSEPSAQERLKRAKAILAKEYVIAPLYYNNPRERGNWRSSASAKLVAEVGCQVDKLDYKIIKELNNLK